MTKLKIYLAGPSAELPRVKKYAAALDASGIVEITHRWWDDHPGTGLDGGLDSATKSNRAYADLDAIDGSRLFWSLWPSSWNSEGCPFESGYATYAHRRVGIDIVVTGTRQHESIFTSLADFADASDDVGLAEVLRRAKAWVSR